MTDRRTPSRCKTDLEVLIILPSVGVSFNGSIVDLSSDGAQVAMNKDIGLGVQISLHFLKGEGLPQGWVQAVVNRVINGNSESGKRAYGIRFLNPIFDSKIFPPCLRSQKLIEDRRSEEHKAVLNYPLDRRSDDYNVLMNRDPHWSFFETLSKVKQKVNPRIIVVSNSLAYLLKRIRLMFPETSIVLVEHLQEILTGPVLVVLSLDTRRKHEPFTFLEFDEYLFKKVSAGEPTRTLSSVSRVTRTGLEINLISLCPVQNHNLARKYLSVARFENPEFIDQHWLKVTKRQLFETTFCDGDYTLREVEDPNKIGDIQAFAANVFHARYNFDLEIDQLFNAHSDFYGVYSNVNNEIINFARVTHHLPGHFLPLMLASQSEVERHVILKSPDEISYGEVFSPYIRSLSAARVYSHLVKVIVSYGELGRINTMFTTYEYGDPKSLRFFSKYLGFAETNVTLRYGSFGGLWGLIYCTHRFFKESAELQLTSTSGAPRLISEAVK